MESWMEEVVSMMSSSASPSARGMPHIKKEEDVGGGGGGYPHGDCSPSNSTVYSPPSNAHSDLQYCDTSQYLEMRGPRSPASPDRQYCSSTTQPLGDLMIGHMDDETKEDDLPRRLCLVCGDVASGFHYGVASCEACKAFFKRTIQGSIEYSCPSSNDCEVTKRRRKACQACRYRKCLGVGMLKEGVRLDRVRGGRQKYRRSTDSFQAPQYATAFGTASIAQHVFQPTTHARLDDNKMLEALAQNEPELLTDAGVGTVTDDLDPSATIVTKLSDLYDRELVGIIGWAKQIPGFTELSLNDQMRLLQSTWAEILILTLAYRSIPKTGKLRFAADFSLDERQARDCGALEVYNQCIHIVDRLEDVRMAKEEYYLLKALVLANSDARLDEVVAPKRFRESILNALTECVAAIRPSAVAQQVCSLLLCLPALRQADLTVRRFWAEVRRDGKVTMNKLFVEMLEAYLRL